MAGSLCLLVVSTLLALVHSDEVGDEYKPTLTNTGLSAIFRGESIHLTCSIPDTRSTWTPEWYRDGQRLGQRGELNIPSAAVGDAGTYICRGERHVATGSKYTPKSLPHKITVDMGTVLLTVRQPVLLGETLDIDCRVQGSPRVIAMYLYKEDVLVSSRTDGMGGFTMPNVNITYQGRYNCMANWNADGQQNSARSLGQLVTVLEVVTKPIVSLDTEGEPREMTLHCKFTFIKPDPAAEVHVYFYRDAIKLGGTARSEHRASQVVLKKAGAYRCRVRVPSLNLNKWSDPENYRP